MVPTTSGPSMTFSDGIYRCTRLDYYSKVVWIQVSKQSYKVTSSRINRLRPGTLKCSMQDRQNVQLCSSTRLFFCCHSSMLWDLKLVFCVQLFAQFERQSEIKPTIIHVSSIRQGWGWSYKVALYYKIMDVVFESQSEIRTFDKSCIVVLQ